MSLHRKIAILQKRIAELEVLLAIQRGKTGIQLKALCLAAIPLEALYFSEMDGKVLSDDIKTSIQEAVLAIRATFTAISDEDISNAREIP